MLLYTVPPRQVAGSQFLQLPPYLVRKYAVSMCPGDLFYEFGTVVSAIAIGPAVFDYSPPTTLFGTISIVVYIYPSIATIVIHAIF